MVKRYLSQDSFSCNVFLICKNDKSILIDPGCLTKRLHDDLLNTKLQAILLTHGHFDHVEALDRIISFNKDVPVYCGEEYDFLSNPKKNGSSSFRINLSIKTPFINLEENEYKIGDFKVKVYFTPGHSEGSVIFYFEEEKAIFFGDTLIETSVGRTDLYSGSSFKLQLSLEKIKRLPFKDDDICYFGHGEKMLFKDVLKYNIYL